MVEAPLTHIFMIGQGACHCLFSLYRQPILRLYITKNKSLFNYLTYKIKNHWCSNDAHFQDWAGSISLSLWPLKAANTSPMHNKEQITFQLPDLQDWKLLTLHWGSFWRSARERVIVSLGLKYGQYLICDHFHPTATLITNHARPKIIEMPLSMIFRMGQRVCLSCF